MNNWNECFQVVFDSLHVYLRMNFWLRHVALTMNRVLEAMLLPVMVHPLLLYYYETFKALLQEIFDFFRVEPQPS